MQLSKLLAATMISAGLGMGAALAADAVPDAMPFDIPYGAPIDVATAKDAVEAAEAEAARRGWMLAIAVVSPSGDLAYFLKMDNTQLASAKIAPGKARTAALFRRPTQAFFDLMETGHPYVGTLRDDLVASPGGIPIFVNGEIIGAIGCSGATGAQDAVACQAGVDAVGQQTSSIPTRLQAYSSRVRLSPCGAGRSSRPAGGNREEDPMRYLVILTAIAAITSQSALAQTRAEAGHMLVQQWCSGCHQVEADGLARDAAPSFLTMAKERGPDMNWVRTRMQVPLYPMQGINLSCAQIEDVVAYFETLPKE